MSMRVDQPLRIKASRVRCTNCAHRFGRIPQWSLPAYQVSVPCPICGHKGVDIAPAKPFTCRDTAQWSSLLHFWQTHWVPGLKYDTHKWVLDTVEFDGRRRTARSKGAGA
jgi:hypothetical protein